MQFGLTVARQENNSDSDVVPESNHIQDLLMPRNNSPPNSPGNAISPKYINIIQFINFVWRVRSMMFESPPWQSRVARQSLSNLIQKFDSCRRRVSALLLSNLIPEFSSAGQKHDV